MYELLPDESYLRNRAILLTDGKPESGAEDTYLKNDWAFKEKDMRSDVINAMEFKRELGEELPRQDVLLICGTNQLTCDTIHYRTSYHASITERRPSYLMQQGFSLPYDSGQGGDGYVPVTSAMATISGIASVQQFGIYSRSTYCLVQCKSHYRGNQQISHGLAIVSDIRCIRCCGSVAV